MIRLGRTLAASGAELVKAKSMYGMRRRRVLLLCAMTISKNIRGFCFALLGGISWGFSGACAQYLFHHYNVDPLWVSSVRMLCAGIVLCAFALAIARGPFLAMWRNRNTVGSLVIFSVFGVVQNYLPARNSALERGYGNGNPIHCPRPCHAVSVHKEPPPSS